MPVYLARMKHPITGLPTFMGLMQSQLMSWPIGLSDASGASRFSKPFSTNPSSAAEMTRALHREGTRRSQSVITGLMRYTQSPCPGPQPGRAQILHKIGQTTLRYYRAPNPAEAARRPVILCVPSLINRYYILDLVPERSLVRYLTQLHHDVLVVDWGDPTENDIDMDAAAYALRLVELSQLAERVFQRQQIVLGYCLGGVLALALTQMSSAVCGAMLLATPWDYQCYPYSRSLAEYRNTLAARVAERPLLRADDLQSLFYLANPYRLYKRYSQFAAMQNEAEIDYFVAVEHWANDGVELPQALARQCLLEWPERNDLVRGAWTVDGMAIAPETIDKPCLLVMPGRDRIVPLEASLPLALRLPRVTVLMPESGHVSMVVGNRRERHLWLPLGIWLHQHFSPMGMDTGGR